MNTSICLECGAVLISKTKRKRYCSLKCWRRKYYRELYQNNEDYRDMANKRSRILRSIRKQKGLCCQCGKEAVKGMSRCQECRGKAKREIKTHNQKHMLIYNQRRSEIIDKLGGKCNKCGYNGIALIFHHLTNEKDTASWECSKNFNRLIDEGSIQLLCRNCHYEVHHS